MEQAQGSRATGGQPVSPVKAVVALFAVLGAALLAWSLSRPDEAPSTSPSTTSNQATATLTEAEAIQEFERLFALNIRAYRDRDESLVRLYAAPDAPKLLEAHEEIRQLLRDGVLYRTRINQLEVEVTALSNDEVLLTQVFEIRPRYVDEETGRDVTRSEPRRMTMEWVMRHYPTGWLLYEGTVVDVQPLG